MAAHSKNTSGLPNLKHVIADVYLIDKLFIVVFA